MTSKKVNIPKKGAGRRLAERLENLGKQKPPERLMGILNQTEELKRDNNKKSAMPQEPQGDWLKAR